MDGEEKRPEQPPKEQRRQPGPPGNRSNQDGGGRDRNRNRRSGGGGGRKGSYAFTDQLEHAICQLVTHEAPRDFPSIARPELATMPPVEVARTSSSILLCDNQHDGPHLWPNGDEVS